MWRYAGRSCIPLNTFFFCKCTQKLKILEVHRGDMYKYNSIYKCIVVICITTF